MQQASHQYWCHICKRQFSSQHVGEINCQFCRSEFCELIDESNIEQNDPRRFIPYGQQQQTVVEFRYFTQPRRDITLFDQILRTMFPNTQFESGHTIESVIEYISRNDPNRYGSPAASKLVVQSLPEVQLKGQSCCICLEEYHDLSIMMPCQHHFHKECLFPWLEIHNSCPVCRFELLTDDEDYNKRKQLK
ncbi:hypothetical protein pb186bvf_013580 [Paramecium bursaria]